MNISFDYIIVFVSIIYGLAIAHALTCISELIQHKGKYKNSWIWWIWAIWFLLLSQGFWVSIYSYWHDCVNWSFFKFSFVSLQASLFYFCFYLFFNRSQEIENDLEESFKKNKRIVFLLIGALFLLMFMISPMMSKTSKNIINEVNLSNVILPVLFWIFAFIKNKIANDIFAVFLLFTFVAQIISGI